MRLLCFVDLQTQHKVPVLWLGCTGRIESVGRDRCARGSWRWRRGICGDIRSVTVPGQEICKTFDIILALNITALQPEQVALALVAREAQAHRGDKARGMHLAANAVIHEAKGVRKSRRLHACRLFQVSFGLINLLALDRNSQPGQVAVAAAVTTDFPARSRPVP